jgi:hypothetical protein
LTACAGHSYDREAVKQDTTLPTVSKACAVVCGGLLAVVVASGVLLYVHVGLDYNSEGFYFDEKTLLVYSQQTMLFLWFALTAAAVMFGFFFWLGRKILRLE